MVKFASFLSSAFLLSRHLSQSKNHFNCITLLYVLMSLKQIYNFKMALVSFPTVGRPKNSLPCITSYNHFSHRNSYIHASAFCCYNHSPFSGKPLTHTSFSPRQASSFPVPFSAKNSEPEEGDSRALEAVLRLYTAIKNKNVHELSDIIGDECQCVCNFFSNFQHFQGKKQVLDFFSYLIKSLGNSIEFVVTPTMHDGMNVGIKWRLQCSKTHAPLGKGFSFYVCHVYHGKVIIRNVEMFLEPLLHIDPFKLKIIGYLTIVMDKLSSKPLFRDNKRAIFLILFVTVTLLHVFKFSS